MDYQDNYHMYQKARRSFSCKVYFFFFLWIILAIAQWITVNLLDVTKDMFKDFYYASFVAMAVGVILLMIFLFVERLRFVPLMNIVYSIIVVELQIVSAFAFVVNINMYDMLAFFFGSLLVILIFVFLGLCMPKSIDLTGDIAVLLIVSLHLMIVAMYFLTALFVLAATKPYTYIAVEISISAIILLFVMYHAQTISGSHFAEMRLNDWLLGSLILFHDFLIVYWLTFYWQVHYEPLKPKSWDFLPPILELADQVSEPPETETETTQVITNQLFGGLVRI